MVNLETGQNIAFDTLQYAGDRLKVGVSWDVNSCQGFDIDASAFLLKADNKIRTNADFIFYNQLSDPDTCVQLLLEPRPYTYQQAFDVCLSKIPADITQIMFVLTVDKAVERQQCLKMINSLNMSVFDSDHAKIINYDIPVHNEEVALMIACLYRYGGKWKFKAVGQGFNSGLDAIANNYNVRLDELAAKVNAENPTIGEEQSESGLKRRTRTSPNQVLMKHTSELLNGFKKILPVIYDARDKKINESNTRMVLDKIFIEIFGYRMDEVKAEQEIQGRWADYVLAVNDNDALVVEVKKAGMPLKSKQVFQATSYGAYSGIEWVLLTNLVEWQVYHIAVQDKVESNLVFSVDLSSGITQQDASSLVLISRYGMSRKNLIEKEHLQANALSADSIISSIMTEDVIVKIRQVIKRDKGITLTNEQVKEALETILNLS